MDVTPKAFRDVEFRESRKGYHPEDVDEFLEQAASGVESLLERARQAGERAQRAEAAAAEAGGSDETLRRTLVLAQRTADMAVQESREQAARIVSSAEQQAQSLVAEAEERARRLHGEALADVHAELAKLEAIRAQAQHEVDVLVRWADEHRSHLRTTLADAMAMVDRADIQTPAPTSTPIDVPFARRASAALPAANPLAPAAPARQEPMSREPVSQEPVSPSAGLPPADAGPRRADVSTPPSADDYDAGPATQAVHLPPDDGPVDVGGTDPTSVIRSHAASEPQARDLPNQPDEEAMDTFFDDNDFADDRRFGGRLRRRR